MIGAAMAARARSATVTTWITTPPTLPPWSSISICGTPSISAIPPAEAKPRATSPATARPRRQARADRRSTAAHAEDAGQSRRPADRGLRRLAQQLAANRAQFYLDFASGPFYGFNRPGAKLSQAVIWNWWRQGMMGSAKAHYDGIKAFSETDFTDDLKIIDVPTLVMHGDDDQIVPIADSALLSAKLLRNSTLKVYEEFSHGMCTTMPTSSTPICSRSSQRDPAHLPNLSHGVNHMRLVIVGSGFAGMYAALSAARLRDIEGVSSGRLEIVMVSPDRRWWFDRGFTNRNRKR